MTEYFLSKQNCSTPVIFSVEMALAEGKNESNASQQRHKQFTKSLEITLDAVSEALTGSEALALVR